jgi:hypothetical protein
MLIQKISITFLNTLVKNVDEKVSNTPEKC